MRIVGKNFRCYEYFDLTFEPGTNNLVVGDSGDADYADTNGSGKTTLGIHAICWARYGKYPDMNNADSIVNISAGKGTEIYHEFKDTQGNPCVIERKRKPNSLKFWQNGVEISGDVAVVQPKINAAIGCDYDFYTKVFLYTGRDDGKFARMTDVRQKEILDTILPLDFDEPKALAITEMGNTQRSSSTERSKISWLEREIDELQEEIVSQQQQGAAWESIVEEDYEQIEQSLIAWNNNYGGGVLEYEGAKTLKKGAAERQHTALLEYNAAHTEFQRVEKLIVDEEARLQSLNVQPGMCPTCGQGLQTTEAQNKLASRMDEINQFLINLKREEPILAQNSELTLSMYEDRTNEHSVISANMQEIYERMIAAQNTVADLTVRLHERPTKDATNPHAHALGLLNEQVAKKQAQISESENLADKYLADSKLWGVVADALGPRGIKHFAFETLCPEMTATAQAFLKYLSPNDLSVEFRSHEKRGKKVKEGFYIYAAKKNGAQSYSDLSGGEKARIDLVVFLTLFLMATKHVSNTGLIVFDEIADTLDNTGKQTVSQLLDFFSDEYAVTSLILTNDNNIAAYISRGYRCKVNGGRGCVEKILEG